MKTTAIFLFSILVLPSCGVMRFTENTVTAGLQDGGQAPGIRTEIQFEPDFPFDKFGNVLIYAWSPIAVFESGKKFQLELTFLRDGAPRQKLLKLNSVTLVEPGGARQAIPMDNESEWAAIGSEPVLYKSIRFFPVPKGSGCTLELDFTLKNSGGATRRLHQRWKLDKKSDSETAIGFKSA